MNVLKGEIAMKVGMIGLGKMSNMMGRGFGGHAVKTGE